MMFIEEDVNISIDLKPSINLRPGNVKDLFGFCVVPVQVLFQVFPTKGKKNQAKRSLGKTFHRWFSITLQ